MKKVLALVIAIALFAAVAAFAEDLDISALINTTTDKTQTVTPFTDVIGNVKNSVVGINNYQNVSVSNGNNYNFGFGFGFGFGIGPDRGTETKTEERLAGTGSGVVIYNEYVLTNYHVIENNSRVTVSTLLDEEEHQAEVVGYDEALDIAIVYVPGLELPYVEMGDSDELQVGEWAICIGNPLTEELAGTVTVGIISALDREITSNTTTTDKYGLKTKVTNTMIQTNAQINSGNSGGGMFNILGQLQGIPSLKYTGSLYSGATIEGIGMCIPINSAKPLIEEVVGGKKTGALKADAAGKNTDSADDEDKPRLGVQVYTISAENNVAVSNGLLPAGLLIDEVEEDSPAKAAGLEAWDIIVEVDGTIITGINDLSDILADKSAGDTLSVKVYRSPDLGEAEYTTDIKEGKYIDYQVTLTDFH